MNHRDYAFEIWWCIDHKYVHFVRNSIGESTITKMVTM
jgi:hypothetical protein